MPRLVTEYNIHVNTSPVLYPTDRAILKQKLSSRAGKLGRFLKHAAVMVVRTVCAVFAVSAEKKSSGKALRLVSSLSGGISLGLTAFCILSFFAAEERGYLGAVGGELFAVIFTVFIAQRVISYLSR